jgi:hypothetical protein
MAGISSPRTEALSYLRRTTKVSSSWRTVVWGRGGTVRPARTEPSKPDQCKQNCGTRCGLRNGQNSAQTGNARAEICPHSFRVIEKAHGHTRPRMQNVYFRTRTSQFPYKWCVLFDSLAKDFLKGMLFLFWTKKYLFFFINQLT